MSLFKRLRTSIYAQLDEMVGEIENHDALIKAAITEQKKKLVAAKLQLDRIRANESKLQKQIHELETKANQWSQRAIKAAEDDEQQALSCMQRHEEALAQISHLKESKQSYQNTAHKMSSDIKACESELKIMIQKHDMMRARQSTVEAKAVIVENNENTLEELATSFDRWELKLAQNEIHLETVDPIDDFEQTYIEEEKRDELKHKLKELLEKNKGETS